MTRLSVLDLCPIVEGGDARQALTQALDLAQHVERWNYARYWVAEHHNMPGIASSATAVVLAHIGAGTTTLRIGAGGIMLPNHAPLMVAEAFGTLAALYPGRIDLGLGRAPGTDQMTARALRRTLVGGEERFPQDVVELMRYFEPDTPDQAVRAVPGAGAKVDVWILGSSTFGAQLAAILGLPFAFASHFAPAQMHEAMGLYRQHFRPSEVCEKPYVMLGAGVIAAETDERARLLATSQQQSFIALRTGRPGKLPPPVEGLEDRLDPGGRALLNQVLSRAIIGSPDTVRARLKAFAEETGADEIMVTGHMFDHADRLASFEIINGAAEALA
jgi:luciferase family oxidoreductase group 1